MADPEKLFEEARAGSRRSLAKLLSSVEKGGAPGRSVAELAYKSGREAHSIGITGSPGAGKSTLVDRLITAARSSDVEQLAVLAVDPSSPFTGGAILGDRVRMQDHALDEGVYIRSMATRGHLGGLAVAVPEAIRVTAAAGIDVVIVETVGVGQVEVEVASATDTTVMVVTPKWGDSVQANKAGVLEAADIFVINKADLPGARETRRDLEQMLELSPPRDWRPPVLEVVATKGDGIDSLWEAIGHHRDHMASTGALETRRRERLEHEFRAILVARIEREIDRMCSDSRFRSLADAVTRNELDPYDAADELVQQVGMDRTSETGSAS